MQESTGLPRKAPFFKGRRDLRVSLLGSVK